MIQRKRKYSFLLALMFGLPAHIQSMEQEKLSDDLLDRSPSPTPRSQRKLYRTQIPDNAIFDAAQTGDLETLKKIFAHIPPNSDTLGTVLHGAIKKNRFNIVRYVLEQHDTKLSINYPGNKGQTPLIRAAKKGSLAIVNHLVVNNASKTAQSALGDTPLHKAAQFGRNNIIRFLFDEDVIELKNCRQETPLMVAVAKAHLKTCKKLRSKGARPSTIGPRGQNLLHIAVKSGYIPILCALLKTTDLDPLACDGNSQTALDLARDLDDQGMLYHLQEHITFL